MLKLRWKVKLHIHLVSCIRNPKISFDYRTTLTKMEEKGGDRKSEEPSLQRRDRPSWSCPTFCTFHKSRSQECGKCCGSGAARYHFISNAGNKGNDAEGEACGSGEMAKQVWKRYCDAGQLAMIFSILRVSVYASQHSRSIDEEKKSEWERNRREEPWRGSWGDRARECWRRRSRQRSIRNCASPPQSYASFPIKHNLRYDIVWIGVSGSKLKRTLVSMWRNRSS